MARTRLAIALVSVTTLAAGCASDDGYSSSSTVMVGTGFYYGSGWYNDPYYMYGPPGYVVVPPPVSPGGPGQPGRPVSPEQPIAKPPGGDRPSTLPSPAPSPKATPSTSSRMPSAQPRMSSPSSRASIPRASRGGGGGRRR